MSYKKTDAHNTYVKLRGLTDRLGILLSYKFYICQPYVVFLHNLDNTWIQDNVDFFLVTPKVINENILNYL